MPKSHQKLQESRQLIPNPTRASFKVRHRNTPGPIPVIASEFMLLLFPPFGISHILEKVPYANTFRNEFVRMS